MIGRVLGNFKIVSRLGRGGMGEVYLAEQLNIATCVAIKFLLPEISVDTSQVERFFNEARAVSRIKHAGIVKIFDVGFFEGQAYLIMEFLDGESLADRLRRTGRLSTGQLVELGRQISNILEATHAVGITHRDLKPDNIFVVADHEMVGGERVKVLDFGIAKLAGSLAGGAKTVGTMGTPTYMAPEQWADSAAVDWRADAYSMGCILFEMSCGRTPFVARTIPELYTKHLGEIPPLVRTLQPHLPVAFEALVARMLAKEPAERANSMVEVTRALEGIAATVPRDEPDVGMAATIAPPSMHTTLGSSNGQSLDSSSARPAIRRWIVAGGVAAASAIVAVVVVASRSATIASPYTPDVPRPVAPSTPPPVAPISKPDAALPVDNPFVDVEGLEAQAHQVTRREYRGYLAKLDGGDANQARPLEGWPDGKDDEPVAWLTQEQAERYCERLGAALPTSEQWELLSQGRWGIDATGSGSPGPLREWTRTIADGLVTVRGGHSQMTDADKAISKVRVLKKPVPATVGSEVRHDMIAGALIGFRCVK